MQGDLGELDVLQPAPFWRRFVARTIDLLILVSVTFVVAIPAALLLLPTALFIGMDAATTLTALGAYFIASSCVEYFLLLRRDGQTLGKGLLGLRVTRFVDGGPLTPRQALIGWLCLLGL